MNRATAITCLFVDIGGVLLTDGWDHQTINGGSSSNEFALFQAGHSLRRILNGRIERIGRPEAALRVKGVDPEDTVSRSVAAPDHTVAVGALMDWSEEERNTANEGVISAATGRVAVCVIRTDEEQMIPTTVCRVLGLCGRRRAEP